MTILGDKLLALHRALDDHGIPHAIGGAIALAYAVNQARATHDIDINVFVRPDQADRVLQALPAGVRVRPTDLDVLRRDGQARLWWDDTPVDLFLSTVELHDVAAGRTRSVPFEEGSLPILSPTDLAVCKAMYGRTKDWADIEAMRDAATVDAADALRWVAGMLTPEHPNYQRLNEILSSPPTSDEGDRLPEAMRPARGLRARPGPPRPGAC
ncbi:MAG TPA: hypothetical protein VFW24_00900 [Acidimicrobiales bacterium]|nr:hypothetical protein [Acidimicrobiales bacterium]